MYSKFLPCCINENAPCTITLLFYVWIKTSVFLIAHEELKILCCASTFLILAKCTSVMYIHCTKLLFNVKCRFLFAALYCRNACKVYLTDAYKQPSYCLYNTLFCPRNNKTTEEKLQNFALKHTIYIPALPAQLNQTKDKKYAVYILFSADF